MGLESMPLRVGVLLGLGAVGFIVAAVYFERWRRAKAIEKAYRNLEQALAKAQSRARDGSKHATFSALAKALWDHEGEIPLDARVVKVQSEALSVIWKKMAKTVAVATLEATCDCGAATRVPAQHGGRTARCKACGAGVRVLIASLEVREALDVLFAKIGFGPRPEATAVEPSKDLIAALETVRDWLYEASQRASKSSFTPPPPGEAIPAPVEARSPQRKSDRAKKTSSNRVSKRAAALAAEAPAEIPVALDLPELEGLDVASSPAGIELSPHEGALADLDELVIPDLAASDRQVAEAEIPELEVPGSDLGLIDLEPIDLAPLDLAPEKPKKGQAKIAVEEFELVGSGSDV